VPRLHLLHVAPFTVALRSVPLHWRHPRFLSPSGSLTWVFRYPMCIPQAANRTCKRTLTRLRCARLAGARRCPRTGPSPCARA